MDKIIPFNKGIRRQPSLGEAGELSELVNLVPKNGELVNVKEMKGIGNLTSKTAVILKAVHKVAGGETRIASSGKMVRCEYNDGGKINEYEFTFSSDVVNICIVGNTVVVSCEDSVNYLLFENGGYVNLGAGIPEIPFEFGLFRGFRSQEELVAESNVGEKIKSFIKESQEHGYVSPFFVRCAIELYDNTIVSRSSPLLMLPSTKYEALLIGRRIVDTEGIIGFNATFVHDLAYRCYDESFNERIKRYGDIIKSVNIYISKPIHLYGNKLKKGSYTSDEFYGFSYSGETELIGGAMVPNSFSMVNLYDNLPSQANGDTFYAIYRDEDEVKRDIREVWPLYLLAKIKVGDVKSEFTKIDFDKSIMDGILNGSAEKMDDDYRLTSTFGASKLLSYNSRLIASNISGRLFGGYPIRSIFPAGNDDNSKTSHVIYYHIKEDNRDVIVKGDEQDLDTSIPFRYLYYPNRNAYKATIVYNGAAFQVDMAPHDFLYGSYYFNGLNSPMLTDGNKVNAIPAYDAGKTLIRYQNQVFFTDVSNPFVFKQEQTISVGTGEIIGMSTSAKALSQGQFGQFPIYVFCTDGIWALEIASDGTFSAKQPISRDVCNNPDSITQIDGAVVFTTDQGLKMIQGSDVVLLSGHMDGHNVKESEYFGDSFFTKKGYQYSAFDRLVKEESRDFREILKTCKIAYDYPNNMLRIYPQKDGYKGKYYVFDLGTNEFSSCVRASAIDAVIPNYPTSIVQESQMLYTFANNAEGGYKNGLLLTRPIAFDDPSALKKLQELKLHYAKLNEDTFAKLVIFASIDGYKWAEVKSLRGIACKYFRFGVITGMKDDEALTGLIVRYDVERTNKLR